MIEHEAAAQDVDRQPLAGVEDRPPEGVVALRLVEDDRAAVPPIQGVNRSCRRRRPGRFLAEVRGQDAEAQASRKLDVPDFLRILRICPHRVAIP
jgi:hypothetical protein